MCISPQLLQTTDSLCFPLKIICWYGVYRLILEMSTQVFCSDARTKRQQLIPLDKRGIQLAMVRQSLGKIFRKTKGRYYSQVPTCYCSAQHQCLPQRMGAFVLIWCCAKHRGRRLVMVDLYPHLRDAGPRTKRDHLSTLYYSYYFYILFERYKDLSPIKRVSIIDRFYIFISKAFFNYNN